MLGEREAQTHQVVVSAVECRDVEEHATMTSKQAHDRDEQQEQQQRQQQRQIDELLKENTRLKEELKGVRETIREEAGKEEHEKAEEVDGHGDVASEGHPRFVQESWWMKKREELLELMKTIRDGNDGCIEPDGGRGGGGDDDDSVGVMTESNARFVYDLDTVRESAHALTRVTSCERKFYAIKANPHPKLLRVIYEAGLGFECVSPGEVQHVVNLFPDLCRERILFTPNFAPKIEYLFALEGGRCTVTVDCLYPLEHWPDVFSGREIFLRLDPHFTSGLSGLGHHKHVRTAGSQSKFGISTSECDIERLTCAVEKCGVKIVGLHCHVGSGILLPDTWANNAEFFASLLSLPVFATVKHLDLGGGLGVVEKCGQQKLALEEVDERLSPFRARLAGVELWMEPGRFLVSTAGVLLAHVTQVKMKGDMMYIGLETGFNSLIRPILYSAYHHIVNLTRANDDLTATAEIVGPICETGDVFGHARRVPKATAEGDVFLIATAGAYCHSMSMDYNMRRPARELFLE